MNGVETIGYLASTLVLAAFCMRDMVALRWLAIASNLAFIAYGALAGLGPVLLLHLLLLPVNLTQLVGLRRRLARAAMADAFGLHASRHCTCSSNPAGRVMESHSARQG